ncbi:MAG: fibronectin type III domain-containing protein [bacterium]
MLVSDKGKEGKYRSIFSGPSKDCYLMDLRPNTEYHIRVHAVMKSRNLKGGASDTVSFHTKVRREEGAGKNRINGSIHTPIVSWRVSSLFLLVESWD